MLGKYTDRGKGGMHGLYITKGTYETAHLRRGGKGWFSEIMV